MPSGRDIHSTKPFLPPSLDAEVLGTYNLSSNSRFGSVSRRKTYLERHLQRYVAQAQRSAMEWIADLYLIYRANARTPRQERQHLGWQR